MADKITSKAVPGQKAAASLMNEVIDAVNDIIDDIGNIAPSDGGSTTTDKITEPDSNETQYSINAAVKSSLDSKVGAWAVYNNKLYAFKNAADKASFLSTGDNSYVLTTCDPVTIGGGSGTTDGVVFKVTVNTQGKLNANSDSGVFVNLKVTSQIKDGDQSVNYDSTAMLSLIITRNGTVITQQYGVIQTNSNVDIDISNYVQNGDKVKFNAIGGTSEQEATSLYAYDVIAANVDIKIINDDFWKNAFVKGNAWGIRMNLSEISVESALQAELVDAGGVTRATSNVSYSQFTSNYTLNFPVHPLDGGGQAGVYKLKLTLNVTEPGLTALTHTVIYNVICVEDGNENNYLVVNNVGSQFKNYRNNKMLEYALYIGYGNPQLNIKSTYGTQTLADSGSMNVVAANVYTYNLDVAVDKNDKNDFNVNVLISMNGTSVYNNNFTFNDADGYSATANASCYIKMSGRTNNETQRNVFVNRISNASITPTITGVNFSNADGYNSVTIDGTELTCFRILSGGKVELPITPLNLQENESKTIELLYRVNNVLDYDKPVITCSSNVSDSFYGMQISSNKVLMRCASALVDDDQSVNYDAEQLVHMTIVVRANDSTDKAEDYASGQIYIDGNKQRTFRINNDMSVDAKLIIGSDYADIDWVALRIYDFALSAKEIEDNACNWKVNENKKAAFYARNNIRNNRGVDFSKVKNLCNVFVIENSSNTIPVNSWSKDDYVTSKVSMFFKDHPTWNWEKNLDLYWQGTTSHGYWRQNFKASSSTPINLDGNENHAAVKKICFKKNVASSMQSHKIGSVLSYTDLARKCGAIAEDERASIWQFPAVGFMKRTDGTYDFIGLYTVGPDKGDKDTFGFTSNSVALEALDNEPLACNFLLPWNDDTVTTDNETYYFYDHDANGNLTTVKSWEDSIKNASGVTNKWKPAYNLVYDCSQEILPWNGTSSELQESNADKTKAYWIVSSYALYYYSHHTSQWKAYGNIKSLLVDKGYGLTTAQLNAASSADEKNTLFKLARVEKFRKEAPSYYDKDNAIFHLCFVEYHAATDNLTKNTYPYIKDVTDVNAKVQWRQDDLDTTLDTENRGKAYKMYCVEIGDNYSEYGRPAQVIFNGENNQFWLLMRLAFASDIEKYMLKFIQALHYGSATEPIDSVMAHFEHYYFDNAQNYFSEALYNEDAKYTYEIPAFISSYGNAGISLSQMLGNHYSAERYWLKMRYIYMSSKYNADNFKLSSTNDVFLTRPYNPDNLPNNIDITTAIFMYPSIQEGNTKINKGDRIYPGRVVSEGENKMTWHTQFAASSNSDQEQRINGMSYIRSLGKLYKDSFAGSITVQGKMLTEILLGTQTDTSNIRSKITGVSIGTALALRKVDMANLELLSGVVSLSLCDNLRYVYAEGTKLTQIVLSEGGNLTEISYPKTISNITLRGKKILESVDIEDDDYDNISAIEVTDCNATAITFAMNVLNNHYSQL